jgi:hypothetical protein
LAKWDVNHDGESVDHPSVLAQGESEILQQENWAYTGNDHHDEDVACNQSI